MILTRAEAEAAKAEAAEAEAADTVKAEKKAKNRIKTNACV